MANELIPEVKIIEEAERIICAIFWSGAELDRPHTYSISLRANTRGRNIAQRLQQAVADGAIYENAHIVKDIGGQTYVEADNKNQCCIMGKYLNSDLCALGY